MFDVRYSFVSYLELATLLRSHAARVPREIELVVGIPRSGMIPAYALGLHRNLPVSDLDSFLDRRTPPHGRTRPVARSVEDPFTARSILLVDDSCLSGGTLREAVARIALAGYPGRIVTCAALIESRAAAQVDLWFKEVPLPRVFEWNLFHHHVIEEACVDFDGVLCVDPTPEENDDGPLYDGFLANAGPLYLPSREIGHIVSARLEKHRRACEEWLERHGVRYRALHLLDLPSKAERVRLGAHHKHKAEIFRRVRAPLFIESDPSQSAAIAQATGRPVLCVGDMKLYAGDGIYLGNATESLRQQRGGIVGAARSVRRRVVSVSRWLRGAR